nr:MAG TPA: hypothetical protein [Caudoviricetes sp.]
MVDKEHRYTGYMPACGYNWSYLEWVNNAYISYS